jgi:hypothetical protein
VISGIYDVAHGAGITQREAFFHSIGLGAMLGSLGIGAHAASAAHADQIGET